MSRAVHVDRRSKGRCAASCCFAGRLTGRGRHGRHSLRCRSFARGYRRQGSHRRHPERSVTGAQISPRQVSLCPAPSRRVLLLKNLSNSAASQPASKRPPEITLPSSLSRLPSYGCDKSRTRPSRRGPPPCDPPRGSPPRVWRPGIELVRLTGSAMGRANPRPHTEEHGKASRLEGPSATSLKRRA